MLFSSDFKLFLKQPEMKYTSLMIGLIPLWNLTPFSMARLGQTTQKKKYFEDWKLATRSTYKASSSVQKKNFDLRSFRLCSQFPNLNLNITFNPLCYLFPTKKLQNMANRVKPRPVSIRH